HVGVGVHGRGNDERRVAGSARFACRDDDAVLVLDPAVGDALAGAPDPALDARHAGVLLQFHNVMFASELYGDQASASAATFLTARSRRTPYARATAIWIP